MKDTWKTINNVLQKANQNKHPSRIKLNDDVIDDHKLIADAFNDYFVNIGPNLAQKGTSY